jgi:hypothetical protein
MFDYEMRPLDGPRWIIGFLVQQIAVPLIAAFFALVALAPIEPSGNNPGLGGAFAIVYSFPSLVGFPLASVALRIRRYASVSGRWIWFLPSLVLFIGLVDGGNSSLVERMRDVFTMSGSSGGGVLYVVTIPSLTCIWYSLRMFVGHGRGAG